MKLLALCAAGIGLMLCASCTNNKHLISDEAERAAVQQDFEARREKNVRFICKTGEMLDRVCRIVTVHVCENSNAVLKHFRQIQ